MESGQTQLLHQNPNPPPLQQPQNPSTEPYSSQFIYYPAQNPNPNPVQAQPVELYVNSAPPPPPPPPGVESYSPYPNDAHLSYYAIPSDPNLPYGQYQHHHQADSQNWVAKEAVRLFGTDPSLFGGPPLTGMSIPQSGMEQLASANLNSVFWTNPIIQPNGYNNLKIQPKKSKIVQSAYCGICKVDCNSKDVLEQHKLGKKHKKNVEKLKGPTAPDLTQACVLPGSSNPVIGPQENPGKRKNGDVEKGRKKAAEGVVDLETKRRKILESGATAEAVRICTICNVVCNSDTVFTYHMAGQKHAAMMKKRMTGTCEGNVCV